MYIDAAVGAIGNDIVTDSLIVGPSRNYADATKTIPVVHKYSMGMVHWEMTTGRSITYRIYDVIARYRVSVGVRAEHVNSASIGECLHHLIQLVLPNSIPVAGQRDAGVSNLIKEVVFDQIFRTNKPQAYGCIVATTPVNPVLAFPYVTPCPAYRPMRLMKLFLMTPFVEPNVSARPWMLV